ncbi:acVLRF1 family peptidyl-tRNA hydrolase [Arthrobacter sp. B1805]|uniref:acVLRF1 family peptidyl-tRNA hydrolase n=1 Tax=Arthrobacter sp. B1805 TaxID=2058892 RepID=UPI000CE5409D|nr:acVLRF1 family peptidyl-tRNA hydrolase [Arthrobacter sp. B1805]
MPSTRSVLVEAQRLDGWLARFADRNGSYTVHPAANRTDGSLTVVAENGCRALLAPPLPQPRPPATSGAEAAAADLVAGLTSAIDVTAAVGLLLIRRGGYSVGVARAGQILSSKTGTRYVQGKTAAGGWSQQRFARRRANQADALVEETAARAAALYDVDRPSCLQLGGDRALASAALGERILAPYAALPQVPFLTVPDPRFAVLKEAARTALSVRITVTDAPED